MLHALVNPDGTIDRVAANIDPTVQTKPGWRWLPVEEQPRPAENDLETLTAQQVVNGNKVVVQWSAARRPLEKQLMAVKKEARRRILARYPDWKQANMTARGVELVNLKTERAWSAEEQAEADALQAAWDWVKSVRSASNAIESMNPIPVDLADDKHWPE